MKRSILFIIVVIALICGNKSFASTAVCLPKYDSSLLRDSLKHGMKICACQILAFQSANHKPRNYVLLAERTNMRSYAYDAHKAKWIIEKEKKHLSDFFYDKLDVINDFVEVSDCRSLFFKMKKKQRSLILYDILDADVRR